MPRTAPAMLLFLSAIACCGCTDPSAFDPDSLRSVRSVALVYVTGDLSGHDMPINCQSATEAFAAAVDKAIADTQAFSYLSIRAVVQSEAYQDIRRARRKTNIVVAPTGAHVIDLTSENKDTLCNELDVDALLIANVTYEIKSSSTGLALYSRPSAELHVPNQRSPVWKYPSNSGIVLLPSTGHITLESSVTERLRTGVKEAADLDTTPQEQKVAVLMREASAKGALADRAASVVAKQLVRAIMIARGEASPHFSNVATSGT